MSTFELVSLLLVLAALFRFVNARYLRLPQTIGVLIIALLVSLLLIAVDSGLGFTGIRRFAGAAVASADLPRTLLNGALSFLLFAGTLHVDVDRLWERKGTVLALATAGVLIATFLFAVAIWMLFSWFGEAVPFPWCIVLGAVLAPTDPIAVGDLLKRVGIPPALEATIAGESLFNDGVGVVVFTSALAFAMSGHDAVSVAQVGLEFIRQSVGGGLLGLGTGYAAYFLMRQVDDSGLELMISLALAAATYSLASIVGVSGPIGVVVAGLLISGRGRRFAMSEKSREYVTIFWIMIDEILNALLFLLMGFEILVVHVAWSNFVVAAAAIPIALVVRLVSVFVPTMFIRVPLWSRVGAMAVLTWGGLRGGISVALALSMPQSPVHGLLLAVCYAVVVWTVVVQGLTMPRVLAFFYGERAARETGRH